ncbi:MAG TPA: pectinesterase family protein [Polyangiaceae bacterium]|nr:pectinesterase family protein [Polyangiaceae bacterium]
MTTSAYRDVHTNRACCIARPARPAGIFAPVHGPEKWLFAAVIVALSGIAGCTETDNPSPAGSGGSGGNGGSATAGAAGTGGSATAGAAGTGGTGAAGTGGTGGSADAGQGDSGGIPPDSGSIGPLGGTPTRPQLTKEQAAEYTILKYLERAGDVAAPVIDNWDPTAGIGDVTTFTPQYTVAASGGTHTSIQAAVDAAVAAGATTRAYISVAPGTYRELVCVPSSGPAITLYGTNPDAAATVIVKDNYSGKPKANGESANPCNANLTGTTYGTSGSATFAAYAKDFQAKNLTLSNDTDESAVAAATAVQAVALMAQGDKQVFENVRVLGNQDTLYVKSAGPGVVARAYFKNCYVEGDVDFVFGRATFVLDGCELKYLTSRVAAGNGAVVAPSTDARNGYGILVINSKLTAESAPAGTAYLGRAWDEGAGDLAGYTTAVMTGIYPNGQVVIRESVLDAQVRPVDPWRPAATTNRPFSSTAGTYPANRLYEYNNTGPGSAPP